MKRGIVLIARAVAQRKGTRKTIAGSKEPHLIRCRKIADTHNFSNLQEGRPR
ncbi:MAG: hypothetical protein RL660_1217 [Bacteroidota bacterium]|jgi:hypothetical protein